MLGVKSNPSKEDIKQIVRDELNVWTETSKNNEKYRIYRKFQSCNFPTRCGGIIFGKKPNSADLEISNLILNACLGETICKMFVTREKLALS